MNKRSERFDQETKELKAKVEAEAERNTKLHETVKDLQNKCSDIATQCINWLRGYLTRSELLLKKSPLQLKISPEPSNISKMRLRPLMKL
jgi:small-conductance mechanosensitive channel